MYIIYFDICKWDIHLKVIKESQPICVATPNYSRPQSAAAAGGGLNDLYCIYGQVLW